MRSSSAPLASIAAAFDEDHAAVLRVDTDMVRAFKPGESRPLVTFDAYELVGRLNDIPLCAASPGTR